MNEKKTTLENEKKINKDTLESNTEKKNNIKTINDNNKNGISNQENRIIDLEKKILNIKNNIADVQLRKQAKIENIRKKSKKDIKVIKNIQLEEFSKKILPIIDSLEEIFTVASKTKIQDTHMIQGIYLTWKSMLNTIEKFGIKREGKENIIFQPHLHQSVSNKESKKIQSNYIISVIKHGYTLNGIVLRKALVERSF